MNADVLLLILLVFFGCAAFLFGVIYVICQFVAWIGRGLFGIFIPRRSSSAGDPPPPSRRGRMCPREGCGKIEYRAARYCSQCGMPLG
ncbi:MAG: hypothetical protein PVI86_04050 [Phycisphaerae bacterium]|jgi:hypothetical protein